MDRIDFKLLFAAYLKQLGYTQTATLLLDSSFTKNDTKDETIMAHHINNLFTEYYSWDGHVSNRALASLVRTYLRAINYNKFSLGFRPRKSRCGSFSPL